MYEITFVGGGCGRKLITVAGLEAVKTADAIIYDDLTDKNVLTLAKKECELFSVGKRNGRHSAGQDEINRLLVECAGKFNHTVRLKGGDSFVFGRGGEEALALDKQNITYKFISGVSSCIAAAESAGIPVTHRGLAQSFTVVTGHSATDKEENYSALAKLDGTLVFLMGLTKLEEITHKLIENGKSPDTPCSVVSNGCSPAQKRFDGSLATISEKSKEAVTPAIIVVGDVCKFHFESKLNKKSVLITGTKSFCKRLSDKLSMNDFEVYSCPFLEIVLYENFLPDNFYNGFDMLVFTSANGVKVFFDELKKQKVDIRSLNQLKFAVIGRGSEKALEQYGIYADFIPTEYTAQSLGRELAQSEYKDCKMLILRSEYGSEELNRELEKAGVDFVDIKSYTTQVSGLTGEIPSTDYIVFASAGGVDAYFSQCEIKAEKIICIGQITADRLKKYTDINPIVCSEHSVEGIIEVIT